MLRELTKDEKALLWDHLWEHARFGLCLVGPTNRFEAANPTYCKLLGYTEAELQTMSFDQITIPDDVTQDLQLAGAIADGLIAGYEMQKSYVTKDNSIVTVLIKVIGIRNAKDNLETYLVQIFELPTYIPQIPARYQTSEVSTVSQKGFWRRIREFVSGQVES
jgi:PAS domain S-box-containing protein